MAEQACFYDKNKRRHEHGNEVTFYQGEAPLITHKELLKQRGLRITISPKWADKFPNVFYSEDGSLWICKLCVEEKEANEQVRGMCSIYVLFIQILSCVLVCRALYTQVRDGIQKKQQTQLIHR